MHHSGFCVLTLPSVCEMLLWSVYLFIFLHNRGPCWTDGQMQKLYIFYTAKRIKKALKAANDSLVPATCGPELLLLWPHAIPEELDHLCNRIGLQAPSHSRSHTRAKSVRRARAEQQWGVFHLSQSSKNNNHPSPEQSNWLTHLWTFNDLDLFSNIKKRNIQ